MISDQAVRQLAAHAGIMPSYRNLAGIRQSTSRETNMALLRACGIQLDNDAMAVEALKRIEAARSKRLLPEELVIGSGKPFRLDVANPATYQLVLEGSSDPVAEDRARDFIDLPPMSSGIHKLTVTDGGHSEVIRLIVAPATAPSVADVTGCERLWGINLALYGLHSKRNPGIGDYEDLEQASTALAAHGAGFLGINPVHAIGWNSDEVISPYSPSHRGYLNASHIAVDRIAPVSDRTLALMAAWKENTGGVSQTLVDYEGHARHHRPLLRALYDDFAASASPEQAAQFKLFCEREGEALRRFAGFESLSDLHGADWRTWPIPLRQPNLDDVSGGDSPEFHMWLQWQAENQLQAAQQQARSAGMPLGLYLDLAVGARRDGAEAWAEQDSIAEGVSIGAPPDHLSPAGQNWNLAAFAPSKLAANDYRAFRTIVSRNMRRCGLLRIDHVLGLNRCFWIPDDGSPGGYIKHNFEALLAIVRIEAERNRTVVIGEDLGLVPGGFRSALKDSGIYSYSVLQYEKTRLGSFRKPSRLPAHSLACFATHDTPTLEGFVKARDIDWWQKLDWIDEREGRKLRRRRKGECAQLGKLAGNRPGKDKAPNGATLTPISHSVHEALAASPVCMVSVQLDDIEGQTETQNLPGTINEHPNWQRRSLTPVDQLLRHPGLEDMGQLMTEYSRNCRMIAKKEKAI